MKMILLALVAALLVGGGWNYHRNAPLAEEDKTPRPYKKVSVEQLDALFEAYQQERARYQQALAKLDSQGDGGGESHAPSDLTGKVGSFEKAQKRASRWNDVHSAMLDQEVELDRIQQERALRRAGGDSDSPWAMVWRRLVTL